MTTTADSLGTISRSTRVFVSATASWPTRAGLITKDKVADCDCEFVRPLQRFLSPAGALGFRHLGYPDPRFYKPGAGIRNRNTMIAQSACSTASPACQARCGRDGEYPGDGVSYRVAPWRRDTPLFPA